MISKGTQYLSAAGFGNIRVTAASMGSAYIIGSKNWLYAATKQAILGAFGARDGAAVIAATNAYLNALAAQGAAGKIKATALAALINEDPMMVCSLGLEVPGVAMPIRWLDNQGSGANIDTGITRVVSHQWRFAGMMNYPSVSARQLNGAQGYVYFGVVNNGYQICGGADAKALEGAVANQNIEFDVFMDCPNSRVSATVNGATYSGNVGFSDSPSGAHFFLFSLNDKVLPSNCKIAKFAISDNEVLARDYIPFKKQGGECGMLDLNAVGVEGAQTFYGNANSSGSFTIPDISYTPSTP